MVATYSRSIVTKIPWSHLTEDIIYTSITVYIPFPVAGIYIPLFTIIIINSERLLNA